MEQITAKDGRGLDEAGLAALAAFMAQPTVEYRGYLIKPTSHRLHPYYDAHVFEYSGYVIVHPPGHQYAGCNAGPGAIWFRSVGRAKSCIDVLHECGGEPPLGSPERSDGSWNGRFWALMKERE